jgi:osmotically-inducible protein OsmY
MAPDKPAELVADAGAFDQTKNADNTKINERDRSALTPMNQGNSAPETDVTAAIRRGVMSDRTLSFTAKNVKIITVGDKVTLRGPVQSERERSVIESLARNTAGVAEVDDQIEVKRQADSK